MAANQLRVIIVGGGPVGLTAAIALERAGIDFLLLERRADIVVNAGSNLVLLPEGLRTLDRLGLLDALNAVSTPLGKINRVDHNGKNMGDMNWFVLMKEQLGLAPRVVSRHDLTEVLYNSLSPISQAKTRSGKKLSNITQSEDGVVVSCADGSSYTGSLVIGADGAHSLVRNIMQKLCDSSSIQQSSDSPYLTTYRCLWLRFPRPSSVSPGTTCEAHGPFATTQSFASEDTVVTGVYERMDAPTRDRIRYTQTDQDAIIERRGHIPITSNSTLTLRDAYNSRIESGLVSLEEGVVENWSWDGRIVLAGDAAHKFTPSTGGGCNNGISDIVVLVNNLSLAISKAKSANPDSAPSKQDLSAAFNSYQSQRYDAVVAGCAGASQATAMATWQTGIHKIVDRHVFSSQRLQKIFFSQGAKKATIPSVEFGCGRENESDGKGLGGESPQALVAAA